MNAKRHATAEAAEAPCVADPVTTQEALRAALAGAQSVHRASLGTLLVESGAVTAADVRQALQEQKRQPDKRLGDVLVASNRISEIDLYRALGEQMGVPFVLLGEFDVDPAAFALLSQDVARARRVLPLMLHNGKLVVATDDPADSETLATLRFRSQRPIEVVLATPSDLDMAIATHYAPFHDGALLAEAERIGRSNTAAANAVSPEKMALEKPLVRLVSNLLLNAVQRRASDVHLRPREHMAEACYRIDGTLVRIGEFSKALVPAIVARIKVLASMDVAEHRLPQDGALRMETPHGVVDMRVSVMPAVFGENVVIRILDRSAALRRLGDVGFGERDEHRMRSLLDLNQGLVLVTGPTGCGKTTTLYAALAELNTGEYHIMTVEDPVEYRLDGLVQIAAQPAIGYGFPEALKHILRHDPDVILIGEIRDALTAKIAIESALTGHLVMSTLHTNSAVQSIARLLEIGIPGYLVNATLAGVLAQRLARRNCLACKATDEVPASVREMMGIAADEMFYRGRGCDACSGTGYHGRVATYELLIMTPAMRQLVRENATPDELQTQAIKDGMTALTDQALALARTGAISITEVLRVRLD
jgi:type IV pilus assembly protein PilB